MFTIENEAFEIDESGITGILDDENDFYWAIDIEGKGRQTERFDFIQPKICFNHLDHPANTNINLDILVWKDAKAYDYDLDNWIGDFYIYDAHYFESSLEWKRCSYNSFSIDWTGKVDIAPQIPGQAKKNFLSFRIQEKITFNGILSLFTTQVEALDVLKDYCDIKQYKWVQELNHPKFPDASILLPRP